MCCKYFEQYRETILIIFSKICEKFSKFSFEYFVDGGRNILYSLTFGITLPKIKIFFLYRYIQFYGLFFNEKNPWFYQIFTWNIFGAIGWTQVEVHENRNWTKMSETQHREDLHCFGKSLVKFFKQFYKKTFINFSTLLNFVAFVSFVVKVTKQSFAIKIQYLMVIVNMIIVNFRKRAPSIADWHLLKSGEPKNTWKSHQRNMEQKETAPLFILSLI